MSDESRDPLDQAYLDAEAALDDEAARAARRARVLAAVAAEPVSVPVVAARPGPAWRRVGWLAAASAAGLGIFVTSRVYFPPHQPSVNSQAPAAISAPAVSAPAAPSSVDADTTASPGRATTAEREAASVAPPVVRQTFPPPPPAAVPAPPPLPIPVAPAPKAFPLAAPAPPPPPAAAEKSARDADGPIGGAQLFAPPPQDQTGAQDVVVTVERRARALEPTPPAGLSSAAAEPGARLRAAATAGEAVEVKALLDQGARIDAPDAAGDTALMKAIEADQPVTAGLLRRRGASLDRRNRAGQSARDMATAKADPALSQALGLAP